LLDVALDVAQDALHHGVGFGVDRRGVERIVATADAEKSRRLLKSPVAEAADLEQFTTCAESALTIPVGDDVLGDAVGQAGDACQQRCRGCVQIHSNRVHAILYDGIERAPGAID